MLAFEGYIYENRALFVEKVKDISKKLRINPDWLMCVMWSESNLNHRITNKIGATGLIQFLPETAYGLGTTPGALQSMSNVQQLDYVYKYYLPVAGKIKRFIDLYTYTFFQTALGKPVWWVFESRTLPAWVVANANSPIDLNKNGKISRWEFEKAVSKRFKNYKNIINRPYMRYTEIAIASLSLIIAGLMLYRALS